MLALRPSPLEASGPGVPLALASAASNRGVDRCRAFAAAHSVLLLRVSLALVYCGFGVLKLIPGASPAEHLAGETLGALSLGLLKPGLSLPLLGLFEVAIGLAVLFAPRSRWTVPLLLLHLAGTFTPLVLFPHETFSTFPFPTLVGQYILKNVVLAAAAISILPKP